MEKKEPPKEEMQVMPKRKMNEDANKNGDFLCSISFTPVKIRTNNHMPAELALYLYLKGQTSRIKLFVSNAELSIIYHLS